MVRRPQFYVRCLRQSYVDNSDGTVTDSKTGLMWQQADDGTMRNWSTAVQYCADLDLGGHTDWRFPRVDELFTIVDYSTYGPAIEPIFDCNSNDYWSGSTHAEVSTYAWCASFYNGCVYGNDKGANGLRPVCARGAILVL